MPKTFNDDEVREAMLRTHRESYELWWRLLNSTRDKEQVKSLYRYREGFDHALINLARKLGVELAGSGTKGKQGEAQVNAERSQPSRMVSHPSVHNATSSSSRWARRCGTARTAR